MTIKHNFVSAKPDGADATVVRPTDWNAGHVDSAGNPVGFAPVWVSASDAIATQKSWALLSGGSVCDGVNDQLDINATF